MGVAQLSAVYAGANLGGYFAAPLSGRTAGFFMFVTLVSVVSWTIVVTTTIARHGAKRVYRVKGKRQPVRTEKA